MYEQITGEEFSREKSPTTGREVIKALNHVNKASARNTAA
jgi:hypothetical protein